MPNEEDWDIEECYIFHNFILSSGVFILVGHLILCRWLWLPLKRVLSHMLGKCNAIIFVGSIL